MRSLSLRSILSLHREIIRATGGAEGVLNPEALKSALAQVDLTFSGEELYPTLIDKAAALGYFIIANHPFVDGNKRIGHAAMETLLVLNGHEIDASSDEQEEVVLRVASGELDLRVFTPWLREHVVRRGRVS